MLPSNGTELGVLLVGGAAVLSLIIGWLAGHLRAVGRYTVDRLSKEHRIATLEETSRLQSKTIDDLKEQLASRPPLAVICKSRYPPLKPVAPSWSP